MSRNIIITQAKRNPQTPTQIIVTGLNPETKQMQSVFVDQKWLGNLGLDLSKLESNSVYVPTTKTVAMIETDIAGSTYVAVRDSSRTKGKVLGASCPEGKENEPLYFEGETVVRQQSSDRLVALVPHEIYSLV